MDASSQPVVRERQWGGPVGPGVEGAEGVEEVGGQGGFGGLGACTAMGCIIATMERKRLVNYKTLNNNNNKCDKCILFGIGRFPRRK